MRIISLSFIIALVACGEDSKPSTDTNDASVGDTTADVQPDGTDTTDPADSDVSSPDASPEDTTPDATTEDTSTDASNDASDDASEDTADPETIGDTGPNPAEDLCWGTGGAWAMGACDCQQDSATTNLGYFFDDELGCIPDPQLLCYGTGGVWEDDACQCAQDGASLNFEFDSKLGCSFPSDSDLEADLMSLELLELIERYTSASQRVWLIDRPGVFDVVTEMDSLAAIQSHMLPGWVTISENAGVCADEPNRDVWPTVDCESDEGMTPTGCFLRTVSEEFDRVSYLMGIAVEYEFGDWTTEEIEGARDDERRVLKVFVSSSHGVTLAFRRLDGRWALVAIDLSRYSCSA